MNVKTPWGTLGIPITWDPKPRSLHYLGQRDFYVAPERGDVCDPAFDENMRRFWEQGPRGLIRRVIWRIHKAIRNRMDPYAMRRIMRNNGL